MEAEQKAWQELMEPFKHQWTLAMDAKAKAEGWALFTADRRDGSVYEIEAISEPEDGNPLLPGGDAEAYSLVARKALAGSAMHMLALYLDGRPYRLNFPVYVPRVLLLAVQSQEKKS